ncbi:hypothetical protein K4G93_25555, partial [Mycobacterium tuberculosis]|nr:hypothetical protein [Mycobacterium tuberculosis]
IKVMKNGGDTMQSLLEGKRVFKQESPNERFLLLDSSKFYKFYDLYVAFGIKKEDLLHPKKWTYFGKGEFLEYCRK